MADDKFVISSEFDSKGLDAYDKALADSIARMEKFKNAAKDSAKAVEDSTEKSGGANKRLNQTVDDTTKTFRRAQDGTTQFLEGMNAFGREIGNTASVAHNFVDVIVGMTRGLDPAKTALALTAAGVYVLYQNFDKIIDLFKGDELNTGLIDFGTNLDKLKDNLKTASDGLAEIKKNGVESLDALQKYYDLRLKIANTEAAISKEAEKQQRIKQAAKDTPSAAELKSSVGKEFTAQIDDETGKTKADLQEALLKKFIAQERAKVREELGSADALVKSLNSQIGDMQAKGNVQGTQVLRNQLNDVKDKQAALRLRDQRLNLRGEGEMALLRPQVGAIVGGAEQGDQASLNQIQSMLPGTKFAQYAEDAQNQTLKAAEEDDKRNQELVKKSQAQRKKDAAAKLAAQKHQDDLIKQVEERGRQDKVKQDKAEVDEAEKQQKERDKVSTAAAEKFQPIFNAEQSGLTIQRLDDPFGAKQRAGELSNALRKQLVGDNNAPGPLFNVPADQREVTVNATLSKLSGTYNAQVNDAQKESGIRGREGLQNAIMRVGQIAGDTIDKTVELQSMVSALETKAYGARQGQQQTRSQLSR